MYNIGYGALEYSIFNKTKMIRLQWFLTPLAMPSGIVLTLFFNKGICEPNYDFYNLAKKKERKKVPPGGNPRSIDWAEKMLAFTD